MSEREVVDEDATAARARVERELLGDALDLERAVERLNVVGERTRFLILYLLAEEGELASGRLADLLDRRQNDLYHHLNALEDAGLVGKYRDGRSRVYALSPLAEGLVTGVFETIRERGSAA